MATFRVWFKDETGMLVNAESEAQAKEIAEERSRENLKDCYFDSARERKKASTVSAIEAL